MAPDGTTSDLAERIRLGDAPAESALVDRFYSRIYAMALARTRDTGVARDLSQEVMMSVLCALRAGSFYVGALGSLVGLVVAVVVVPAGLRLTAGRP